MMRRSRRWDEMSPSGKVAMIIGINFIGPIAYFLRGRRSTTVPTPAS